MIEIKLLPNLFSSWRVAELSELDTTGWILDLDDNLLKF